MGYLSSAGRCDPTVRDGPHPPIMKATFTRVTSCAVCNGPCGGNEFPRVRPRRRARPSSVSECTRSTRGRKARGHRWSRRALRGGAPYARVEEGRQGAETHVRRAPINGRQGGDQKACDDARSQAAGPDWTCAIPTQNNPAPCAKCRATRRSTARIPIVSGGGLVESWVSDTRRHVVGNQQMPEEEQVSEKAIGCGGRRRSCDSRLLMCCRSSR